MSDVNVETKPCVQCKQQKPLNQFRRGGWGKCLDCLPKDPPKKRGRPKGKVKIKEVLVVPDEPAPAPEPQPEPAQETPAEEPKKRHKARKSVRQLRTQEMRRLLDQRMPISLRADIMIALAQKVEEPVTALRALTEINELTGIRLEDAGKMAVPLFALPRGVDVKTEVEPVVVKKREEAVA